MIPFTYECLVRVVFMIDVEIGGKLCTITSSHDEFFVVEAWSELGAEERIIDQIYDDVQTDVIISEVSVIDITKI